MLLRAGKIDTVSQISPTSFQQDPQTLNALWPEGEGGEEQKHKTAKQNCSLLCLSAWESWSLHLSSCTTEISPWKGFKGIKEEQRNKETNLATEFQLLS